MYHYVRDPDPRLPHQRFLHVEDADAKEGKAPSYKRSRRTRSR